MLTYGGVMREVPIVPFAVASGSTLVRGMVVQWNSGTSVVEPWSVGTNIPFGVCTTDANLLTLVVDVYCGKGSSVLIKCASGIIPVPAQLLYWAASGVVNVTVLNTAVAKAIGTGFNGFVEAILI
jgi:hypothetical protein